MLGVVSKSNKSPPLATTMALPTMAKRPPASSTNKKPGFCVDSPVSAEVSGRNPVSETPLMDNVPTIVPLGLFSAILLLEITRDKKPGFCVDSPVPTVSAEVSGRNPVSETNSTKFEAFRVMPLLTPPLMMARNSPVSRF